MSKTNENKLIPTLRFPEFLKDKEWVGDELGELSSFFKGKGLAKSDIATEGINPCVHYGELFTKYTEVIKEIRSYTNISEGFKSEANDVLMPTSDVTPNGLAKASCIKLDNIILGGDILVIRPKSMIYGEFLSRFIRHREREVLKLVSGTTVFHLYGSSFEKFRLIYPSIDEQKKIAACLLSLDEVITAESQKLDILKDHKKGILQNMLPQVGETIPKFRFKEFQDSDAWAEATLLNIANFRRGSFPQPYGLPEWYDDQNGMPFIQVFDVGEDFRLKPNTKRKISSLAAEHSVFIPVGTLIITIQGSIGRVAITQYDAYIDRTLLLFEEFYLEIDITFFAYTIFLLFEIEKQKAPGGIIKTITKEVLSSFVVKMPSIEEQKKIASCLTSLDELISAQTERIESLQLHKKGLLQGLFPNLNEVTE